MDISVIIPAFNERESLPELSAWIARVMQENGYSYEVLIRRHARARAALPAQLRQVRRPVLRL